MNLFLVQSKQTSFTVNMYKNQIDIYGQTMPLSQEGQFFELNLKQFKKKFVKYYFFLGHFSAKCINCINFFSK